MSRIRFLKGIHVRLCSTKEKMKVMDELDEGLTNKDIKHRMHPGIVKPRVVEVPKWLLSSIDTVMKDEGVIKNQVLECGEKLAAHLHSRLVPIENTELMAKIKMVQSRFENKFKDIDNFNDLIKNPTTRRVLKQNIYNWMPIQYDRRTSMAYLFGRSMQDYSVLYRVLNEIHTKDPNFKPKTLFDFGSGIGTVMWAAAQFWKDSIKEYLCVDVSSDINSLSKQLIEMVKPKIQSDHIFYRQFMPASPIPTYDIVVSAYSLLELPNVTNRLEIITKLWRKAERYLVFIEQGTNAGYRVINEARDFILNSQNSKFSAPGHIFLPCPHDLKCPRYRADKTPCNFQISYFTLPLSGPSKRLPERFSYLVLKKGERSENDEQWPRIVRPTLKRSKHVICRLCTSSGKLEEQIFTTWKNGKNTYRCARSSEWGDLLPFKVDKTE